MTHKYDPEKIEAAAISLATSAGYDWAYLRDTYRDAYRDKIVAVLKAYGVEPAEEVLG